MADHAAIRALIDAFAISIDTRDQETYTDTFTEDATLSLPFGSFRSRGEIAAMPTAPPPMTSHHLVGTHRCDVNGDDAQARWNVIATHIFDAAQPDKHAQAGGWYEATLRRTEQGWRFSSVQLHIKWNSGAMIPRKSS
ncbi:nuclear transport factor 2 family protein [Lentzea pudingi]|uniref:nuclear transport factor 2 family protein n=1 Tax=Lentzea pudingi TaxID=1789439 RepID=UPI00166E984A|nr:nuclear transport factor 2 family protein [Lentzea pudingi]